MNIKRSHRKRAAKGLRSLLSQLGVSPKNFAALLGTDLKTVRPWLREKRLQQGPAGQLILMLQEMLDDERSRELLKEAVRELVRSETCDSGISTVFYEVSRRRADAEDDARDEAEELRKENEKLRKTLAQIVQLAGQAETD